MQTMSPSFINRFDCIILENQLKDISLKELIKFLLHTTNLEKWRSPFNHNEQNKNLSDIKDEKDFNDRLEGEIETSKVDHKQKQLEKNSVEQFNPTTAQIDLVYNNIETSMTISQIAQLCHAVAKSITFFEGNFSDELIVHFTKDLLKKKFYEDFSFKGKYEKLQEFFLSHLQPEGDNVDDDDDDHFFYQKSPLLKFHYTIKENSTKINFRI